MSPSNPPKNVSYAPLLFALLLLFVLFLAGCNAKQTTVYHTGSEGIALAFVKDQPPAEVYEGSIASIGIALANKGAADVNYSDIFLTVKGDVFYVNVSDDPRFDEARGAFGPPQPGSDGERLAFHGKSPAYPAGEALDLQPIVEFKPIQGLREMPTTQLFASLCYPYNTVLGTSVCVDANAFNGNKQKQVCNAETLTFKDQGAPVAITSIENRPSPVRNLEEGGRGYRDIVQPVFIIHVRNVGSGAVLGTVPVDLSQDRKEIAAACTRSLARTPSVTINATLSSLNLSCSPNPIPLRNEEGFTTCVLAPTASGSLSAPNYLGAFRAELTYLYQTSTSRDVQIIRSPLQNAGEPTYVERDASPSFIDGKSRCEYCDQNRADARCSGMPEKGDFSCACSEQRCLQLSKQSPPSCVFGQSWCAGTTFCCDPTAK